MVLGGLPDVMGVGDHNLYRVHSMVMRAHNLFSPRIYGVTVFRVHTSNLQVKGDRGVL